jgi:hypothetical protein
MKKLMVCLLMVLVSLPAAATAIFSDDFTDGNRTGWYYTNGPTVSVTDGTMVVSTTSTSTTIFRRIAGEFTDQSLTAVGDKITLSLDFKLTDITVANVSRAFRFGLFTTNGTSQTVDSTTTAEATVTNLSDDKGYFVGIGQGTGTSALLREDGVGASFMAGTDTAYLPASSATPNITDTNWHTAVLTITKDTASTVFLEFNLDGGAIDLSNGGSTTVYTTFDEIGFSNGAYNTDFVVDNIVVDFAPIPEPATLSLLALGGFFAASLRKRRA